MRPPEAPPRQNAARARLTLSFQIHKLGMSQIMNIARMLGAAATLSLLGGAFAWADALPASQASLPAGIAGTAVVSKVTPQPAAQAAWAAPRKADRPVTTYAFANFGQWDEAASEN